jgi:glycosyltransferase involved in cell wall biosynthesis
MKVTILRSRAIDSAVNKVAEALAQNGHDVKLLVWDREGNKNVENNNGYTTYRFRLKAPHDKPTVLFYVPIWWLYVFFFLLKDDSDVIHACDFYTLMPAIPIKLIRKVKLCYTIYDFYANNLPDGRPYLIRKLLRKWIASVDKFGIRFTDVLFLVDESRYEEVKGARINRLVYIYNSPPDFLDVKQEQEPQTGTRITIFYAGLLHKSRGLEAMMKAVGDLDGVRLIIGGTGAYNDVIEKLAGQYKNIQYIGWVPYEEVVKKTIKGDISFAFYDPKIPNNRYASPNKLFEAMMCEKPIIVSDDSTMADIVRKENCGIVVPYGDVGAIKEAVIKLKNDPGLRQKLGKNGRKAYEEKYNWDIMEKRLINAYKKVERET